MFSKRVSLVRCCRPRQASHFPVERPLLLSPKPGTYSQAPPIAPLKHRHITSSSVVGNDIEPARLEVIENKNPKPPPPSQSLVFGRTFTDHMLTIPWSLTSGWGVPKIEPYGPLQLEPCATVFHYAQTIFEGMKAYRDENGRVTMFRPDKNMERMNTSAQRIALPRFNGDSLLKLIKTLVYKDRHWIPQLTGHSLYIRPTLIGTQLALGVGPPDAALLFVICSPVGPYYSGGFKPVSLYGTTEYVRAFEGGTGSYKLGVNYAPGVVPQREAAAKGYDQNLWLYGPDHHLTEVGTMNMFAVFRKPDGTIELVSPPLDGIILPGITRDSVLALARGHASGLQRLEGLPAEFEVAERPVTMKEVKVASQNGTLVEIFGTGTAVIISSVNRIGYLGEDIMIPTADDSMGLGPIARVMFKEISGRQFGSIPSDWSVTITE